MLSVRATRSVAVSSLGVRNSLILGSFCFLSPLCVIRSAPVRVLTGTSRRARRACISLRSSWACWGSGAPGHE